MEFDERRVANKRPRYDCLLFDLDDTLYPLSSGLTAAGINNITDYVVERLGVDRNRVTDFCRELHIKYGTVLSGLREMGYEVDYDDYHSFDRGRLPYENLKPDLVLKNLLLSMPQRKIIFTNGDKVHAADVLSRLGLEDCFESVICFETLNSHPLTAEKSTGCDAPIPVKPKKTIICKPSKEAIEQSLRLANADPQTTIFFDDSTRNIAAGKRAGLHTVLVGTPIRTEGADFAVESIHNIKEVLPEIWEEDESSET